MMSFEDSLCNLLMYPDEMHELIDYITDWRCKYMEEMLDHIPGVEAIFGPRRLGQQELHLHEPGDLP